MERELLFGKLAALDVVLSVAFYVVATALAFAGLGVWALVAGVLAQGVAGVIVAYVFHPFRPKLALDGRLLRPILKFGVPFQLTRMVGFVNTAVTPIYAGSKLGSYPLGLITWAQSTAYFPLKLVEIVGRIAFPLYSRLQDDKPLLGESFGRSIQLCAAFTAYFVALCCGMGSQIIHVVFGDKWLVALPLLIVYAIAISVGFLGPIVGAVLDATGRPGLVLPLALFWTALNWIVVPLTTSRWGTIGFAIGYCVHVVVGNLVIIALTARLIPHSRLLRRLWSPALGGAVVYFLARYVLAGRADSMLGFIGSAALLLATHAALLFLFDRRGMMDALKIVPSGGR
jgi:PST family polysaccharide transporter